ncbi:hypothetical protein F2Q70_00044367 [Brassica cretica]|uniref:Wall-associated receptor kinase galacturonan-binding domain-containing protein n=1 Tax=Brassica cretica TaxID=69181 RepID=A0A8S9KGP6_BRACR|nr:hypothetical protein F2Q70_00044367 [Brassica cretica]
MSSYNPSSLLIIFSLLFLLIFDLTVAGSCPSKCGGIDIPYPFGIGKGCYLNKWYEIKCDHNNSFSVSGKPVPVLSIPGKEVVNISLPSHVHSDYPIRMTYGAVRIKYQITSRGCSSNEQEPTSLLDLMGSPFYVSDSNTMIAIGCNNRASLTNMEPSIVGCFSSCLSTNHIASNDYLDTVNCYSKSDSDDAYEYCSERRYINETSCNGNRCCKASMPSSDQQVVGVRIDDNSAATRGCKVAFLTDEAYSLLDGTDPKLLLDKRYSTVELQWFIDTTNLSFVDSLRCITMKEYQPISRQYSHGMNNYASCACDFNSSVPNYASCSCNIGYRGNPYILGGCKDISSECPNCVYRYHAQLVIGIGSSFGSLIFICGIYGLYRLIRKQRRLNQKKKFFKRNGGLLLQQQLTSTEGSVEKTRMFSSKELEKATENFSLTRILGQGGQGTVYKGMLVDENRLFDIIDARIRDGCKLNQVTATANLARKCLNLKGRKRPSMREVSMELEKIRASSVDMELHEYGSENEEDHEERVVDANIQLQSCNNVAVTAPTSQYDVGTSSLPISDVEPLFPFQTR